MPTLYDRSSLAQHPGFRDRVTARAILTAIYVSTEASSGDSRKDSLRKSLATNVLNDPKGYTERFAWAAVSNDEVATAGTASLDSDLEYVTSFVWDQMAGV